MQQLFDPAATRRRRQLRLAGFDYARPGIYFVTLCVQDRACLLGSVLASTMDLSDPGKMVRDGWAKLGGKFPVTLDVSTVMPNHLHGLLQLDEAGVPLGRIVQWFKTMTTNAYLRGVKERGWQGVPGRLWQRNYFEHIVRGEASLDRIRRYIEENPIRWDLDRENPAATGVEVDPPLGVEVRGPTRGSAPTEIGQEGPTRRSDPTEACRPLRRSPSVPTNRRCGPGSARRARS